MTQAPNQGRRVLRNRRNEDQDRKLRSYQTVAGADGGTEEPSSSQHNDGWIRPSTPPTTSIPTSPGSDQPIKRASVSIVPEPHSFSVPHSYPPDVKPSSILTSPPAPSSSSFEMSGAPDQFNRPGQYYQEESLDHASSYQDVELQNRLEASMTQQQHYPQHALSNTTDTYSQWTARAQPHLLHQGSYDDEEFAQVHTYTAPHGMGGQDDQQYYNTTYATSDYLPAGWQPQTFVQPSHSQSSHSQPTYGPLQAQTLPTAAFTEPAPVSLPTPTKKIEIEKANLKFVRYQEANKLYCGDDQIFPKIKADCARNMAKIDSQPRLVCYRRNYLQIDVMFRLPLPRRPGAQMEYRDGFRGKTLHVVDPQGRRWLVGGFAVGMTALADGYDGKDVELIQHTAKRDKSMIDRVNEVTLLPNSAQSGTYRHNIMIAPTDETNKIPILANQLRAPHPIPSHHQHTFERVQFKAATANNGQRRAAQQFFHLAVTLHADINPWNSDGPRGTHLPQWLPVRHLFSHGLVVRGRSPTHYYKTDMAAPPVVNDEEDGTINDYDLADDETGQQQARGHHPNGVVILPRPLGPVIPAWAYDDDDGHRGRAGRSARGRARGTAGVSARSGAGRSAASGSARQGNATTTSRQTGGARRTTRTSQNVLAPQDPGRVSKPSTKRKSDNSKRESSNTTAQASATSNSNTLLTDTSSLPAPQLSGYSGFPIQTGSHMVRDTEDTSSYAFPEYVYDSPVLDLHEQQHEHGYGHGLDLEPNDTQPHHEDEATSLPPSNLTHEQSSSSSPGERYIPASFNTPPLHLSQPQPYQPHDQEAARRLPPVPAAFEHVHHPVVQQPDNVSPTMLDFMHEQFAWTHDPFTANQSAERSSEQ